MRRSIFALAFAGLLAIIVTPAFARRAAGETTTIFSPKGGQARSIAEAIDAATKHIDIAMYSISTGEELEIMQALARASDRGVRLRMIFNKARTGSSNKRKSIALEDIGVDVRYVSKTMHEKFAIIDGEVVINGSGNWSTGANENYSENTQFIPSPKYVITEFKREFRLLLSVSKDFDPEEYR